MKFIITTQQIDDEGNVVGTLTHTVNVNEKGEMVREIECPHTFSGDFFEVVEGISECEAALRLIGESC